jgi:hypothetical protein
MPQKSESQKENRKGSLMMRRRAQKASRGERSGDVNNFRQQLREKKLSGGSNKNGCFPKLFMLALPLMAVGAYLLLT